MFFGRPTTKKQQFYAFTQLSGEMQRKDLGLNRSHGPWGSRMEALTYAPSLVYTSFTFLMQSLSVLAARNEGI